MATVWDHLTDPVAGAARSTHPMWAEKLDHGYRVGTEWTEHHTDDCGSDPVRWVVLAAEAPHHFTVEGLQSGGRQRATTVLRPTAIGTEVVCRLELSISLRARATVTERLLMPVLLATRFGATILGDSFAESVADDQRHLEAVVAGLDGR